MKSFNAAAGTFVLICVAVGFGTARQQPIVAELPVEIAVLAEANWDRFAPEGKEVDAIYGDIVLRNGHVVAVIAQPLATRHANMTVRDVAGAMIDLNDPKSPKRSTCRLLSRKKNFPYRSIAARGADGAELPLADLKSNTSVSGVSVKSDGTNDRPEVVVLYELNPASQYLTVTTTFTNRSQKIQAASLEDDFRADGGKEEMDRSPNEVADRFWLHDRFWGQAYGIDAAGFSLQLTSDARTTAIKYQTKSGAPVVNLEPGKSFQFSRRLYPGTNMVDVNSIAGKLDPTNSKVLQLSVKNKRGRSILAL